MGRDGQSVATGFGYRPNCRLRVNLRSYLKRGLENEEYSSNMVRNRILVGRWLRGDEERRALFRQRRGRRCEELPPVKKVLLSTLVNSRKGGRRSREESGNLKVNDSS